MLAHCEAKASGYDEAIMLNDQQYISEGSGENIFMVKDDGIYTPPLSAGILPGITRETVKTLAKDEAFELVERDINRSELYIADEVFMTGTAAEITPVREIDDRKIGNGDRGPVTKRLQDAFWKIVKGDDIDYMGWLDFVEEKR
jgi:branched-chain amino acid aminotransferase